MQKHKKKCAYDKLKDSDEISGHIQCTVYTNWPTRITIALVHLSIYHSSTDQTKPNNIRNDVIPSLVESTERTANIFHAANRNLQKFLLGEQRCAAFWPILARPQRNAGALALATFHIHGSPNRPVHAIIICQCPIFDRTDTAANATNVYNKLII